MILTINTQKADKSRRKLNWGDFWISSAQNPERIVGVDFTQAPYACPPMIILTHAGYDFLGGKKTLAHLSNVFNLVTNLPNTTHKVRKARFELTEPNGETAVRELDFITGEYRCTSILVFNELGVKFLSQLLNVYGHSELAKNALKIWHQKEHKTDPFLPTLLHIHLPQDAQSRGLTHYSSQDFTVTRSSPSSIASQVAHNNASPITAIHGTKVSDSVGNDPIILPGCGGKSPSLFRSPNTSAHISNSTPTRAVIPSINKAPSVKITALNSHRAPTDNKQGFKVSA